MNHVHWTSFGVQSTNNKCKSNWEFSPQGISDELVFSQEFINVCRLVQAAFTGNWKEHNMPDFKNWYLWIHRTQSWLTFSLQGHDILDKRDYWYWYCLISIGIGIGLSLRNRSQHGQVSMVIRDGDKSTAFAFPKVLLYTVHCTVYSVQCTVYSVQVHGQRLAESFHLLHSFSC